MFKLAILDICLYNALNKNKYLEYHSHCLILVFVDFFL